MAKFQPKVQSEGQDDGLREKMIAVNRVTKVVKGGRRFAFRAVVVVDEPTTKLAALTSGELDFAGIQPAHASFVEADARLATLSGGKSWGERLMQLRSADPS